MKSAMKGDTLSNAAIVTLGVVAVVVVGVIAWALTETGREQVAAIEGAVAGENARNSAGGLKGLIQTIVTAFGGPGA